MEQPEQISFIKAAQQFFSEGRFGRKIEIPEFKQLTEIDKIELREMLIGEGIDVAPFKEKTSIQT